MRAVSAPLRVCLCGAGGIRCDAQTTRTFFDFPFSTKVAFGQNARARALVKCDPRRITTCLGQG